jgi:hypothetical protein
MGRLNFAPAYLAGTLCTLLGEFDEAMSLVIGIAIEMVANVEAEVPIFLFNLRSNHRRHHAGIYLAGDLCAQVIDDFEPTVPT